MHIKITTFINFVMMLVFILILLSIAITFNFSAQYNVGVTLLFIIIFISTLIVITSYIFIHKNIIVPVRKMSEAISNFHDNSCNIVEFKTNDNEIGIMIKEFFIMKKKLVGDYQTLEGISLTDELTGISNRRAFFERAESVLKISHRNQTAFSIMILDIDFFKRINDTYGHLVGDDILKYLVNNIANEMRSSDIFARFGGEEFIILLPDTEESGCYGLAQKIRTIIERNPYTDNKLRIPMTVSIGISQFRDENEIRDIITRADEALYRAKDHGRNKVEIG